MVRMKELQKQFKSAFIEIKTLLPDELKNCFKWNHRFLTAQALFNFLSQNHPTNAFHRFQQMRTVKENFKFGLIVFVRLRIKLIGLRRQKKIGNLILSILCF